MTDREDADLLVAQAIRAARISRNLTLSQVSAQSGVSVGHLSRLENSERMPTVRVLMQLARAYGMSLSDLVGESSPQAGPYVSRAAGRTALPLADTSLVALSDPASRSLQVFELELEAGRQGEQTSHPGEEWIYVLSGRMDVIVGSSTSTLSAGDVVQFAASMSHHLVNPYPEAAKALFVAAAGQPIGSLPH